jgi:hypothetical protein
VDSLTVAFLDDDNSWRSNHLSSLFRTSERSGGSVVHSWRNLYWPDGRPFTEHFFPWLRYYDESVREYQRCLSLGFFSEGSNVARDRIDNTPDGIQIVDAGEWLLPTDLALEIGFAEKLGFYEWRWNEPEDVKFLKEIIRRQVPVASTHEATLNYFLGGMSNEAQIMNKPDKGQVWQRPNV